MTFSGPGTQQPARWRVMRASSLVLLAWAVMTQGAASGQIPAFPGAEGAGGYAIGGRNGDVYHVTTTSDSGAGSLRYGIDTAPPAGRTIVFDVSGMIALNSTLRIRKPYITIAGQTAPGIGICIKNFDTQIEFTHDVVLRHMRFRPGLDRGGTASGTFHADSLELNDVSNITIDHCSMSWSVDECIGSSGENTLITIQWCFITEALHETGFHPYGPTQKHSDGTLLACEGRDCFVTAHHNLWAHHNLRMPRVRSYDNFIHTADLRNNVTYNWGDAAAYGGGETDGLYDDHSRINFCGTYAIAGPSTRLDSLYALEDWGKGIGGSRTFDMEVYLAGSKIDTDRDGAHDGINTGWSMTTGPMVRRTSAFEMPGAPVTTEEVDSVYERVLNTAGAMPGRRDAVDSRIRNEVITRTGRIINSPSDVGGYPEIPFVSRPGGWDTDGDGMPNWWELQRGHNPAVADQMNDSDGDGYTNLEAYLNHIAGEVLPGPAIVLADFDADGDVDQYDFGILQGCFTAAGDAVSGTCTPTDVNGDGVVNQADFSLFAGCVSGANVAPDLTCDDNF